MNENKNSVQYGGITPIRLLGVAFVVLKLLNLIDWSWWLVLLPFYGGLLIFAVVILAFYIYHSIKRK